MTNKKGKMDYLSFHLGKKKKRRKEKGEVRGNAVFPFPVSRRLLLLQQVSNEKKQQGDDDVKKKG